MTWWGIFYIFTMGIAIGIIISAIIVAFHRDKS